MYVRKKGRGKNKKKLPSSPKRENRRAFWQTSTSQNTREAWTKTIFYSRQSTPPSAHASRAQAAAPHPRISPKCPLSKNFRRAILDDDLSLLPTRTTLDYDLSLCTRTTLDDESSLLHTRTTLDNDSSLLHTRTTSREPTLPAHSGEAFYPTSTCLMTTSCPFPSSDPPCSMLPPTPQAPPCACTKPCSETTTPFRLL